MGTSAIAYTVVGMRIDIEKLYRVEYVSTHRNCPKVGDGPFCSSCGKPVEEKSRVEAPIEGFVEYAGNYDGGTLHGVDLVTIGHYDSDSFISDCISAAHSYDDENLVRMGSFDIDKERAKLQKLLEPLGLWDPDQFGVWTALEFC